ncbi:glycosyltransferase [Panacibacter sp. DH6]|uniref:Glycosyltransferase n=1 Tax=Panacibacter microcysteis TaxID=2793269 RepID=A0A931GVR6_9BACT|nr:glycosyltransferase [Panacibacter microcysteis]MBG9376705.1 glycosyltransferase [Panacibacter microcysteis]
MFLKEVEPYIVIAQQEWKLNLGSNARNLAVEFSKTRPVMYVNPAIDIKTSLLSVNTAAGRKRLHIALGLYPNTIQVADNLWVHTPSSVNISINWLKQVTLYNMLNKSNAKRFFKSLKKAIDELGWQTNKCVVFNDSQMFTGLYTKEYLQPLLNFYYIRDNLIEHPYFKFHGSRIEPKTIQHADSVFANSSYLAEYARKHHSLSIDIGQGCELEIYDAKKHYTLPDQYKSIPHPRIGYIGFLTGERLDIALLEELAMKKPEWHFVFIGPEEIMFQQSRLHAMKNVHFLGAKKPEDLPAYMQHLDVCLNPQLINPLTVGNYPRKIDEYLAMGKPTVATDTPAMQMFLPHVHLAKGVSGYISAIEAALNEQSAAGASEAISFAKAHTWQACVEKIYQTQKQLLHV